MGEGRFIDNGMGVVIGETAVVGKNVTLYHGVTLSGASIKKGKPYPALEDGVVVESVPRDSVMVGVLDKVVEHKAYKIHGS